MSKILFWSPLHGQGQTSNLHVTAFIMSMFHKKRVLMMQTHFTKNNLEGPLVGQNVDHKKNDDNEIFQDIGLDMAVTYSNMNKLDLKMLENCCISFHNILLLPGTETKNKETFDRDIGRSVGQMIRDADACVDMVLIDSNSGDDELSFRLMDIADLIVINLTQRRYVLEQFFMEYGSKFLDNKKAVYLFGDYDDNSSYNINNCRRKYKNYIKAYNSGVIPYCTQFMDAQSNCSVLNFMKDGLSRDEAKRIEAFIYNLRNTLHKGKYEKAESDYFFHRSRLSVERMLDLLYVTIKKERREEYQHDFN